MAGAFKIGDHVTWNCEAGHVSGTIVKVHKRDFDWKGYTHHASSDDPQYEIKSDKTEHVAVHKGSALKKIRKSGQAVWASFQNGDAWMSLPKGECPMAPKGARWIRNESDSGPPSTGLCPLEPRPRHPKSFLKLSRPVTASSASSSLSRSRLAIVRSFLSRCRNGAASV